MVTGAGALFQPLVGFLLDLAWTGETALGARVYETGAYRLALASLIACGLAGLLCLLAGARDLLPPAGVIRRPNPRSQAVPRYGTFAPFRRFHAAVGGCR